MIPSPSSSSRRGTVIIIVAGISALMAAMALTFLVRMRSDVEESEILVREAQAHIMKVAACNFVMESARLGWDPKLPNGTRSSIRRESFGWIDVRNGKPGPLGDQDPTLLPGEYLRLGPTDNMGNPIRDGDGRAKWDPWTDLTLADSDRPAKRCPMYVMVRPPFAVSPEVAVNAITAATGFQPLMSRPDPQPFQTGLGATDYVAAYTYGDKQVDTARYLPSWFRVWRATPATFVITCGVGETQGFRDWDEVIQAGETGRFGGNTQEAREMFNFFQLQEQRLWYLIEWSPHVAISDYQHLQNEWGTKTIDTYLQWPINVSQSTRSQGKKANQVGTISLIQRLLVEPRHW